MPSHTGQRGAQPPGASAHSSRLQRPGVRGRRHLLPPPHTQHHRLSKDRAAPASLPLRFSSTAPAFTLESGASCSHCHWTNLALNNSGQRHRPSHTFPPARPNIEDESTAGPPHHFQLRACPLQAPWSRISATGIPDPWCDVKAKSHKLPLPSDARRCPVLGFALGWCCQWPVRCRFQRQEGPGNL